MSKEIDNGWGDPTFDPKVTPTGERIAEVVEKGRELREETLRKQEIKDLERNEQGRKVLGDTAFIRREIPEGGGTSMLAGLNLKDRIDVVREMKKQKVDIDKARLELLDGKEADEARQRIKPKERPLPAEVLKTLEYFEAYPDIVETTEAGRRLRSAVALATTKYLAEQAALDTHRGEKESKFKDQIELDDMRHDEYLQYLKAGAELFDLALVPRAGISESFRETRDEITNGDGLLTKGKRFMREMLGAPTQDTLIHRQLQEVASRLEALNRMEFLEKQKIEKLRAQIQTLEEQTKIVGQKEKDRLIAEGKKDALEERNAALEFARVERGKLVADLQRATEKIEQYQANAIAEVKLERELLETSKLRLEEQIQELRTQMEARGLELAGITHELDLMTKDYPEAKRVFEFNNEAKKRGEIADLREWLEARPYSSEFFRKAKRLIELQTFDLAKIFFTRIQHSSVSNNDPLLIIKSAKSPEEVNAYLDGMINSFEEKERKAEERRQGLKERGRFATSLTAMYTHDNKPEEISLNFEVALSRWTEFYLSSGLELPPDFPEQMQDIFSRNHEAMQAEIEKFGFDEILLIPGGLPIPNLHNKMSAGYNPTWEGDNFKNGGSFAGVKEAVTDPRIILIHKKDAQNLKDHHLLKDTLGKTAQYFIDGGEQGNLTNYLIYQKVYFKETGKHLDEIGWTWLPGSHSGARVVNASWTPAAGQLNVHAVAPGGSLEDLGCRLSRSFL